MDYYDKIRAAMWQFRNEKRAIQTGCVWHNEWTEKYITKEGTPSGGHSFAIIGWKEDYLKIQNSVGVNIGNNGIQWIHKDLVNKLFTFGAIMFLDKPNMTDEEILKKSEEYRLKKNTILEKIISLLNKIISLMKKQIKIKKEPIKDILLDNQKNIKDKSLEIKDIFNGQIIKMAKAIEEVEGYFIGSRSQRNNNSGNLKFTSYTKSLGAKYVDKQNFCIFLNYEKGFSALCQFIKDAAENKLKDYHDKDIYGFFKIYAPSLDGNFPIIYAKKVALKMEIIPETKMAELLK